MEHDLGAFREGFSVWRNALDLADDAERPIIFANAANEAVTFIARGLDRIAAVDELTEIAQAFGLDIDESQAAISHAFEYAPAPVPVPAVNGHDKQPATGRLIQSSAEFVRGFVPPDYLIDGIMQRRFLYALTGKTGSGKTAIVLLIAASVALGRSLGGHEVERGRVLYFAGENADDVRMRWIAMGQQMDFDVNTVDVFFIPGRFRISEMRERITNELADIGDVVLLVVDTSAAFYEGREVNSNTEQAAHGQLMRTLVGLPGGPAILVNCHPVKNAAPDNLLPLGAGAFLNEIDGNLTCSIDGPAVEVHWQGKHRGPDFEPLIFEIVAGITHERLIDSKQRKITTVIARSLSEVAKEEMTKAGRAKADRLLLEIDQDGKGSVATFARRCGMLSKGSGEPQKSSVQKLLAKLTADRFITKVGDDYAVTEKGKKRVTSLKEPAENTSERRMNDPDLFSRRS